MVGYPLGSWRMRPGGFEPPTNSLEGCCSIHLSYGRADCAATAYGAVLHRASKQCHKQCQNLMLPCPEAQGRELLLQDLIVLLHTILHHLGAMPHRTEVSGPGVFRVGRAS